MDMVAARPNWSGHVITKKKDGRLYEEDSRISPIGDDPARTVTYVAVIRDVTEEVSLRGQLIEGFSSRVHEDQGHAAQILIDLVVIPMRFRTCKIGPIRKTF